MLVSFAQLLVTYWAAILLVVVVVNGTTFMVYGMDKALARSGGQRISENNLLTLALLGGTPAAYAACHHFRHKTVKRSFRDALFSVALIQAMAIGVFVAMII